jgi:DNA polymerase
MQIVSKAVLGNEWAKEQGAHCDICPLKGNVIVPSTYPKERVRLAIVGEAPGRVEEKLGQAFLGQSGKLLDRLLDDNSIPRASCFITNAALCRGEGDKENDQAAECCAPRLTRELASIDDRTVPIVALGKTATVGVLGVKNITSARGFIWETKEIDEAVIRAARRKAEKPPSKDEWAKIRKGEQGVRRAKLKLKADTLEGRARLVGRTVLPTVHPAFVLRSDAWHPILEIDFRRIKRVLDRVAIREDEGPFRVGGLEVLRHLRGGTISLDVETDGVKPLETKLLCVGMSDGSETVVIYPWKARYAKEFAEFLRKKKLVVAHNLNFDRMVLEANGVK